MSEKMHRIDFENANCKMSITELCKDLSNLSTLSIERPLKCISEITNLDHLLAELKKAFSSDYVNVEYVSQLMWNYKSDPKDWRRYAKFDRYRYTRNLVDEGNGAYNVMLLCWGPGHASAIHDHADSHCFMKILSGELNEVRYEWPRDCGTCKCQPEDHCDCLKNEKMKEIGRSVLEFNDVCYINDTLGLHRVENPNEVDGAVSLHLYCPPFDSCKVFDPQSGKPNTVKVTFTSKYGKRIKIHEDNKISEIV